jgi:polysaccharide export outer membrane protein
MKRNAGGRKTLGREALRMKSIKWILPILLMLAAAAAAAQEGAPVSDYIIGPGDVLNIGVWKDEALTRQCVVLPDGKIAFPLIGEMTASGRTVTDISKELSQKLGRFVPGVDLSVAVHQVNSLIIYVIGRVNSPGRFVLNTDVNVLQALAMAGGLNPFAKRGDIKIFREADGGSTKTYSFDYDVVSSGDNIKGNIRLKRGDVIVVP